MDCLYHPGNPITYICKASHTCSCQRKLCALCQYVHGVDYKHTVPIQIFKQMIIKKLEQSNIEKTPVFQKERLSFKATLSKTQDIMKKTFSECAESIIKTFDLIEKEYQKIIEIKNSELAKCSYTDLENLVKLVEGNTLEDLEAQKNSFLLTLQNMKEQLEREVSALSEKLRKQMLENHNSKWITQIRQQYELPSSYQQKKNFLEILASLKNFDSKPLSNLIRILKKEKTTDCVSFFSQCTSQKLIEEYFCQMNSNPPSQHYIQHLHDILRNVQILDFNKINISQDEFKETKKALIAQITQQEYNEKYVQFFKFLIQLTAIDDRFIQCGSNSLNLLVEIRADLNAQNFESIRIKDISLIDANFLHSNLSGSEFENVYKSGMNLNGALLFNCKWRNIKIQEMNQLEGQNYIFYSVCFSPDGTTLAAGSSDNSIQLWDAKKGQQKNTLNGHKSTITSICYSSDGTMLASGSNDNSIHLWDVNTGHQKGKLDGHTDTVNSVHFSSDGTTLVSGSSDYSVFLWDVKTRQLKRKFFGHTDSVCSVCFSPDGITLASGSDDKSICIWDIMTGQQNSKLDYHTKAVNSVCFSPDGITLASGSSDNLIYLWDVKKGQLKCKLHGHVSAVYSIQFNSNGSILDQATGINPFAFEIFFSSDDSTLASSSWDSSIRLWDVRIGQQNCKFDGHTDYIRYICFSPDGTYLAFGNIDNTICLWDVKTGQQKNKLDFYTQAVSSVCPSLDGTILTSVTFDNSIRLWDVKTGREISSTDNNYDILKNQFNTQTIPNKRKCFRRKFISENLNCTRYSQITNKKNYIYSRSFYKHKRIDFFQPKIK